MKKSRNFLLALIIVIALCYSVEWATSQPNPTSFDPGAIRQPSGQTSGDILYFNGTTWARLPKGTLSQVVKQGASFPEWGTDEAGGSVSDVVYGAAWDGDTATATSKNAIYDYLVNFDADSDGSYLDEDWLTQWSGSASITTIGTITTLHIENFFAAPPDDLGDFDNYHLVILGEINTGRHAGMLFSTDINTYGGSAIVHYDTGAGGVGDLVFYTKQSISAIPPVEVMRLDDAGDVTATGALEAAVLTEGGVAVYNLNELNEWAGSASITTLGTIGTGVWEGTVVATTYGGTGSSSLTRLIQMGTDTIASNWQTFYSDDSGWVQQIPVGTNTWVLTSQGTGTAPAWAVAPGAAGGDAWSDPVDSDLIPDTDDAYDVGSSTSQFKDGYFDGTLEADVLTEAGNAVPNVTDNLSVFSATTSAELAGVVSDETGTGLAVFNDAPDFDANIEIRRKFDTPPSGPSITLDRWRDGTPTDDVSSGDHLGSIYFDGYHTALERRGAEIHVIVDNTPGAGDMPSRIEFKTSSDGSVSPTLRMTIDSDGNVDLGADDNAVDLVIHSGGTQTWYDPSDDTSVTASVRDGTTVLDVTGTIDATGLQVGGVAVLTSASIELGTDTTGAYVTGITDNGSGTIVVVGSGIETATVTIAVAPDSLDFTEITDSMTLDASTTINTDDKTLIIQASSTQTVDIFAVKLSTGSDVLRIESTGSMDLIHTATANDDHTIEIDTDAAGFGDIKSIDIAYTTGAISAGEDEGIILVNIDETLATGGEVFAIEVLSTEGFAEVHGLKVGAVVNPIHQDSGVFANPTTGTDNTPATDVAAMIDGATATTTAIFENDDEYILVGAGTAFEEIEFILTTDSSGAGIAPTFGYSVAGTHTFTTFSPVDGTNGFKNTGVIAWDASDLTSHVANNETGTFDIKIIRTRNSLAISPVLGYMKVASTTEYVWDKDGDISIRNMTLNSSLIIGGATVTTIDGDKLTVTAGTLNVDTRTIRIPIMGAMTVPDSTGECYMAPISVEMALATGLMKNLVMVLKDPSADTGFYGTFLVPKDYVDTANIVVRGVIDGTVGTTSIDFEMSYIARADNETVEAGWAEEVAFDTGNTNGWTNEDELEDSAALTDSNFAADDTVYYYFKRDQGTDDFVGDFHVTGLFFEYQDD